MIKPMLLCDFDSDFTDWPLLAQVKRDGVRCLAQWSPTSATWELFSRTGKFLDVPHVVAELNQLPERWRTFVFDGELYAHGVSLQLFLALLARQSGAISFHIFDVANTLLPFNQRVELLADLPRMNCISVVDTTLVNNLDEVDALHITAVADGFEGLVLRTPDGLYQPGKRTWQAAKLKTWHDAEFRVDAVTKTDSRGRRFLSLKNDLNAKCFFVLWSGPEPEDDLLCARVIVRFTDRTDGGIPRHAVAVAIRAEFDGGEL